MTKTKNSASHPVKMKEATSPPVPFDFDAFFARMFHLMVSEMATSIPVEELVSLHNNLVDKYHETEGSDNEPPVTFALSVCDAAIMQKQAARFLN